MRILKLLLVAACVLCAGSIVDAAQEWTVTVGEGEWALPGTLTVPEGQGPFPAVVLVHGSGPHDRDETVLANKPFRDLAAGLAKLGVATLRYDKRTKVHAAKLVGVLSTFTANEETVDDALAAVQLLRRHPDIRREAVYVLGHSFGGMLVPRIGRRDPDIAGFIVLAGNTRAIDVMLLDQIREMAASDGTITAAEQAQLAHYEREVEKVRDPNLSPASGGVVLGAAAAYWLDLRGYRPQDEAKALTQRLLILQGGRDYQVTRDDYDGWRSTLEGRSNATFKWYPVLNHLFIEGQGTSTPAEYAIPGHVAEAVIRDIAAWIR